MTLAAADQKNWSEPLDGLPDDLRYKQLQAVQRLMYLPLYTADESVLEELANESAEYIVPSKI